MSSSSYLPETETKVPILHPPGGGKTVEIIDSPSRFKVLPSETGGAYAVLEQEILPGTGPPLHVHHRETEIFYILEGQFEVFVKDRWIAAPAGTCATLPRDIPHTFRNVGSTTGRLLLTILPGNFGNFFIETDGVSFDDHAKIRDLCAKYDVEILQ